MDETKVFCQKNSKFVKHDENHATRYSLIVQSFAPESTSSVRMKNPFEFIVETVRLAKQDEPVLQKNILWNATKQLHTTRGTYQISLFHPSFVVLTNSV